MIRTFIAIPIPEEVKSEISAIQNRLRSFPGDKISWTRPEGIHLTLKFLGDVEENLIKDIAGALSKTAGKFDIFQANTTITGGFPNLRKPRVLWLGIEGGENLIRLQKEIDDTVSKFGFQREKKAFHPHLTVGRVRFLDKGSELPKSFKEMKVRSFTFKMDRVELTSSLLKPTGAEYRALHSAPLQ